MIKNLVVLRIHTTLQICHLLLHHKRSKQIVCKNIFIHSLYHYTSYMHTHYIITGLRKRVKWSEILYNY